MKPVEKTDFIGRTFEQERILEASHTGEASILIVYGRRRIGKTELIEHTLKNSYLIKLEGVEDGDTKTQMDRVLYQLGKALQQPHITRMVFSTWLELFDFMADLITGIECTLYFEEVQWLAEYKNEFIADLKLVWDNRFRHFPHLFVVLCGSSPSFMINHVVHSEALYNRSTYELHLKEFSLAEARALMKQRSLREIMDAYLTLGGVPEYLKRLNKHSSVQIGICNLSFKQQSFLTKEYKKIFISSFANSLHYQKIIQYLSKVKFATRKSIENHLKISAGGTLTTILIDLELCGFIEKYTPFQVKENSLLQRYCIADNYLRFYYKFIQPIEKDIEQGVYNDVPMKALNRESYQKWLGYAFERFCRINHKLIAKIIGFSAIRYRSGVFFNRKTEAQKKGYQIDLIFERADHVLTVCEIKYLHSKVGIWIIDEFEEKLSLLDKPDGVTIEKVLIALHGADENLTNQAYFDYIITLEDLFSIDAR